MKSFILVLVFSSMSIFSFGQQRSMGSDGILGKLQTIIDAAEARDMEVVRIEADIIRTSKETYRSLDPTFTYIIAAVGSDRIEDLDIEVYKKVDGEWTLLKKDTDSSNVAMVEITPSTYAEYGILVKVYKFKPGYDVGHYGLAVIHN